MKQAFTFLVLFISAVFGAHSYAYGQNVQFTYSPVVGAVGDTVEVSFGVEGLPSGSQFNSINQRLEFSSSQLEVIPFSEDQAVQFEPYYAQYRPSSGVRLLDNDTTRLSIGAFSSNNQNFFNGTIATIRYKILSNSGPIGIVSIFSNYNVVGIDGAIEPTTSIGEFSISDLRINHTLFTPSENIGDTSLVSLTYGGSDTLALSSLALPLSFDANALDLTTLANTSITYDATNQILVLNNSSVVELNQGDTLLQFGFIPKESGAFSYTFEEATVNGELTALIDPSTASIVTNNTPPTTPDWNIAVSDSLIIKSNPDSVVNFAWTTSTDADDHPISYSFSLWEETQLAAGEALFSYEGTDTLQGFSFQQLTDALIGQGIAVGDTGNLVAKLSVTDGFVTVNVEDYVLPYRLDFLNVAPIPTDWIAPLENSSTVINGLPTDLFELRWESANDADGDVLRYTATLYDAADESTPIFMAVQRDTAWSLSFATLDSVFESASLAVGDSLQLIARLEVTDEREIANYDSLMFSLTRGIVNTPPVLSGDLTPKEESILLEGLPTDTLGIRWNDADDADSDNVRYTWSLSADNFVTLVDSAEVESAGLTRTLGQLKALFGESDTLDVQHRVIASDGNASDTLTSSVQFILGTVNTPPVLGRWNTPSANDIVNLSGSAAEGLPYFWTKALDADEDALTYFVQIATDNSFENIGINESTTDTTLNITYGAIAELVSSSPVVLYTRVGVSDGVETLFFAGRTLFVTLGELNNPPTKAEILAPADGDTVLVEGLGTELLDIRWSASTDADGDSVFYSWNLVPAAAPTTVLVSESGLTDTLLQLPLGLVDSVLAANGIEVGGAIEILHQVRSTDRQNSTSSELARVILRRGEVNSPPPATTVQNPDNAEVLTLQGDEGDAIRFDWEAVEDPDGDEVSYIWQLSLASDFEEDALLVEDSTVSTFTVFTTRGFADIIDALQPEPGETINLFHRVLVTDGVLVTESPFTALNVIRERLTSVEEELPMKLSLEQNYPNPFNPVTTISFSLPEASFVRLAVFDMSGKEVISLVEGVRNAGTHSVQVDAARLPSGVYIYRLQSEQSILTRKMTLLK